MSFPGGSGGKEFALRARDLVLIPGPGRCHREGNGNPFQYSCLENPTDGGAWWAVQSMGSQSDMTEQLILEDWWVIINHPNAALVFLPAFHARLVSTLGAMAVFLLAPACSVVRTFTELQKYCFLFSPIRHHTSLTRLTSLSPEPSPINCFFIKFSPKRPF